MRECVCSVPHSGTRTLVKHLGLERSSPRGRWLHFDFDEGLIRQHRPHLHIPVRHPMSVAASWARRGKNVDKLVRAYLSMFAHLTRPHTLHKMEDITPLDGLDDRDRMTHDSMALIGEAQRQVQEQVVLDNYQFFLRFYNNPMATQVYGSVEVH